MKGGLQFFSCASTKSPFFLLEAGTTAVLGDLNFSVATTTVGQAWFDSGRSWGIMPLTAYNFGNQKLPDVSDQFDQNAEYKQQGLTADVYCTQDSSSPIFITSNTTLPEDSEYNLIVSSNVACPDGSVYRSKDLAVGNDFVLPASCPNDDGTQTVCT